MWWNCCWIIVGIASLLVRLLRAFLETYLKGFSLAVYGVGLFGGSLWSWCQVGEIRFFILVRFSR